MNILFLAIFSVLLNTGIKLPPLKAKKYFFRLKESRAAILMLWVSRTGAFGFCGFIYGKITQHFIGDCRIDEVPIMFGLTTLANSNFDLDIAREFIKTELCYLKEKHKNHYLPFLLLQIQIYIYLFC